MSTTVQVSVTTKQMLEMLKEDKKLKTFDQALQYLLDKELKIPKSMFGALKGLGKWTKADRADFHEW